MLYDFFDSPKSSVDESTLSHVAISDNVSNKCVSGRTDVKAQI